MDNIQKQADKIMYDAKFQAACQNYAHANGSSGAIAVAAVRALVDAQREASAPA